MLPAIVPGRITTIGVPSTSLGLALRLTGVFASEEAESLRMTPVSGVRASVVFNWDADLKK
jgi:hypothetical protein